MRATATNPVAAIHKFALGEKDGEKKGLKKGERGSVENVGKKAKPQVAKNSGYKRTDICPAALTTEK